MIESVRDGEPWQADYSFLELCKDRIVFAVPKSHPLAGLKHIDYTAMQPYTMVTSPENLSAELDQLAKELSGAGLMIRRAKRYDFPLFIDCSINNWIVQIPEAWTYLLPNFQILPFETGCCHRYGFFYREPVKVDGRRVNAEPLEELIRMLEQAGFSNVPLTEEEFRLAMKRMDELLTGVHQNSEVKDEK